MTKSTVPLVASSVTGDLAQMTPESVERREDPAAYEEVGADTEREQHPAGDRQRDRHATRHPGEALDGGDTISGCGGLHRLGRGGDVGVRSVHEQPDHDENDEAEHGEQGHSRAQAYPTCPVHTANVEARRRVWVSAGRVGCGR